MKALLTGLLAQFCLTASAQNTIISRPISNKKERVTNQRINNSMSTRKIRTSTRTKPTSPKPPHKFSASYWNGVLMVDSVRYEMVKVNAGTFTMGATPEMQGHRDNEEPVHQVTLTNNYYLGKTEVTQALWEAVMGSNPSYFKGDDLPVGNVSWNDCQEFISKLNVATGKKFRLPTEAEWEYAARGGNNSRHYQYSGSNDINAVAWYRGNSNGQTHSVGTKQANELGLYDMAGNVWEWCQDWYCPYTNYSLTNPTGPSNGSVRVMRGGCYYLDVCYGFRSSYREAASPTTLTWRDNFYGLRLALSE